MDRDEVAVLADRVRSVEQRLRITLAGSLLSVVVLGVFWVGAQQAASQTDIQSNVKTRSIDVYDNSNKRRIGVGMSQEGNPGIWLYDPSDKARVHFGIDGGVKPEVWFADETGAIRMHVGTNGSGDPGIWIYDASGKSVTWSAPGGMFWSVKP